MTTSLLLVGLLTLALGEDSPSAPGSAQDEAAPPEKELPHWSGNVDVGILQKQGNTESLNGRLDSKVKREAEKSLTTITSWWLYEEDSGELTERKYGTRGKYDRFLSAARSFYAYGLGQIGSDLSSNVDVRYIAGGGLGYKWFEQDDLQLTTDIGISYLNEEFRDGTDDDSANVTGTYDFLWKITEDTNYDSDLVGLVSVEDSDDVLLTWTHSVTTDLGWNFRGGIRYQLDWDNTPAAGSKRDDHQIALTIGWGFGS